MSNQSFRDVNTVVLAGVAIAGVQRVRLGNEGAVINFNSDAGAYRQDVGLTKQVAQIDIERLSSAKLRDIISAVFTFNGTGSITFGRVQRARVGQRGTVLRDSGDADTWVRYVGVTDIAGDAEVNFRDLPQIKAAGLTKGRKGTLTLRVPAPRTGYGLPSTTAAEVHVVKCMVAMHEAQASHGAMSDGRTRFEMYGTSPWSSSGLTGGQMLKPVSVGQRGAISWNAPAADAASSEATTVTGAVITDIEMTLEHGGYARSNYKAEAGASDGTTPPVS